MKKVIFSLTIALPLMAGCTTMGTNISGSFKCDAPNGICAPSLAIDDLALAKIMTGEDEQFHSPAVDYGIDDGPGRIIEAKDKNAAPQPAPQDYRLRVIYPQYQDRAGQHHEREMVDVNVHLPGANAMDQLAERPAEQVSGGLLSLAEKAPPLTSANYQNPTNIQPVAVNAIPSANPIADIKAEVEHKLADKNKAAGSFSGKVE